MLSVLSVDQLLGVLSAFRGEYERCHSITYSYQRAVSKISRKYDVTYQTIGDLCRRRLRLIKIDQLYGLLEKWVTGDAEPLLSVLLDCSKPQSQQKIRDYFNGSSSGSVFQRPFYTNTMQEKSFDISLDTETAKRLGVLSAADESSSSDWLNRVIPDVIDQKYEEWFKKEAGKIGRKPLSSSVQKTKIIGSDRKDTFINRKPKSFTLLGHTVGVRLWFEILLNVCKILHEKHIDNFEEVLPKLRGTKHRYFSEERTDLQKLQPKKIPGTRIYAATKLHADAMVERCRLVIESFGYNPDDLKIETKTNE